MKTYFKTRENIDKAAKSYTKDGYILSNAKTATCACGQSPGYIILDQNLEAVKILILCKNCYDNSTIIDRGE